MPTPMTRCLPQRWPATAHDRPRPTPGPLPPDGGDLGGKPRPVRAIPGASRPRGAASCLPHWRRRFPFTNAVESASDQLRRATKNRGHSPLRRGRGRTPVATRAATAANAPKSETRTRASPPANAPPPRQSHAPPTAEQAPARARTCTCTCTCTTKALPAPLRPPTRRENQDPRRPKWRTSALSGAATL